MEHFRLGFKSVNQYFKSRGSRRDRTQRVASLGNFDLFTKRGGTKQMIWHDHLYVMCTPRVEDSQDLILLTLICKHAALYWELVYHEVTNVLVSRTRDKPCGKIRVITLGLSGIIQTRNLLIKPINKLMLILNTLGCFLR